MGMSWRVLLTIFSWDLFLVGNFRQLGRVCLWECKTCSDNAHITRKSKFDPTNSNQSEWELYKINIQTDKSKLYLFQLYSKEKNPKFTKINYVLFVMSYIFIILNKFLTNLSFIHFFVWGGYDL